jgi:hypothetical protein
LDARWLVQRVYGAVDEGWDAIAESDDAVAAHVLETAQPVQPAAAQSDDGDTDFVHRCA